MSLTFYQVDAFTSRVFGGNPAAICPLEQWLPDNVLQSIALENNLSETAFFCGQGDRRQLRWFTPMVEVDLCGHATLASAFVLMSILEPSRKSITFETKSGDLMVDRGDRGYTLDFPARPPKRLGADPKLSEALGSEPKEVWKARDIMAVFDSEDTVRALRPNFSLLTEIDAFACIVTAPGSKCDFVSRFFAPAKGINEDPVTGSAHCTLVPYWAERLGKTQLEAVQVSPRVGELSCELRGDRVRMTGNGVLYAKGEFYLP